MADKTAIVFYNYRRSGSIKPAFISFPIASELYILIIDSAVISRDQLREILQHAHNSDATGFDIIGHPRWRSIAD
ncbi:MULTISPECIES: hypothetical protein [unclassified Microcoleus]|uniref:hypothetical protein n=1 Tax=unclassified Microcoleus TaxID=2642155 RepID=UPI002FD14D8F